MEGGGGLQSLLPDRFLKLFSKNVPFVNKKGYVLQILSIFLNLKSFADFPRKMGSNIAGNL
jgi:hypothetical protein